MFNPVLSLAQLKVKKTCGRLNCSQMAMGTKGSMNRATEKHRISKKTS